MHPLWLFVNQAKAALQAASRKNMRGVPSFKGAGVPLGSSQNLNQSGYESQFYSLELFIFFPYQLNMQMTAIVSSKMPSGRVEHVYNLK